MTYLTFPSNISPQAVTMTLESNTQKFESPLNKTVQTLELPGARWQARIEFHNRTRADAMAVQGFLYQLRGMSGRFYLWDLAYPTPAGTASGVPILSANIIQGATQITTSGWGVNQSLLLQVGDKIGIGGELKAVVGSNVSSDSSGNATITFEPPLRNINGLPLTTPVVTVRPTAIFRLLDDTQAAIQVQPGAINDFTFECVEAFV